MHRHHPRLAQRLGKRKIFHHPPRRFIGKTDGADFPRPDQFIQRGQHFVGRGEIPLIGRVVAALAEVVGVPVRPVNLIEVHVVGLKPFQAFLQGSRDPLFRMLQIAAADIGEHIARADDLGRQHHLVAVAARRHPAADDPFGVAIGLFAGRNGIHLGGIDEIHPTLKGPVHLGVPLGFAVLLAPRHGAQANATDFDVATP